MGLEGRRIMWEGAASFAAVGGFQFPDEATPVLPESIGVAREEGS